MTARPGNSTILTQRLSILVIGIALFALPTGCGEDGLLGVSPDIVVEIELAPTAAAGQALVVDFSDVVVTNTTCVGWAVALSVTQSHVTDSKFNNNQCNGGELLIGASGGTATLANSEFKNNVGGGWYHVWNQVGALDVTSTTFVDNIGTALGIAAGSLSGCEFTNNGSLSGGANGALVLSGPGPITIQNTTFTANKASNGGAIVVGAPATITNCTFTGNQALLQGGLGGAIYAQVASVSITGSTFTDNSAGTGGALAIIGSPVAIGSSVFRRNRSRPWISMSATGPQATESGTPGEITVNAQAVGSAIHVASGTSTVTGSCFQENRAFGVHVDPGAALIALDNWWGDPTGPSLALGGHEAVTGPVDYASFKQAAPAICAVAPQPLAPIPVNVTLGGSATPITDYALLATQLDMPSNGEVKVPVVAVNDALIEGDENVIMTVDAPASADDYYYGVQPVPSAVVTIVDDGNGVQCIVASDCPDPGECLAPTCIASTCGSAPEPAGTICAGGVCDGSSACVPCLVNGDCPDPGECQSPICEGGTCSSDHDAAGSPCSNGVCDGNSVCVGCLEDGDCGPGEICDTSSNTCTDGSGGGGAGGSSSSSSSSSSSGSSSSSSGSASSSSGGTGFDTITQKGSDDSGCCGDCAIPKKDRDGRGTVASLALLVLLALRRRRRAVRGEPSRVGEEVAP